MKKSLKKGSQIKKHRKAKRLLIFLLVVMTFAGIIMFYFSRYVNPVILTTSETKVKMLTSRAVNSAISEILNNNNIYDDLITISQDSVGNVNMIQANAVSINRLSKDIARLALVKIESIGDQGISIPLGSFTGMPILMGRGPEVLIKIVPIGTLDCIFKSEFVSAGINQTVHRIYLEVTSVVNLILPIFDNPVQTYTEVLICESVIVGDVPEFYFNNPLSYLVNISWFYRLVHWYVQHKHFTIPRIFINKMASINMLQYESIFL